MNPLQFNSLPAANAAPVAPAGGVDLFGVGSPAAASGGGGSSNIDLLGGISMPQSSTLTAAPGQDTTRAIDYKQSLAKVSSSSIF